MDSHPIKGGGGGGGGGAEIVLAASCYRNCDKLQPDGSLGSYADITNSKSGNKQSTNNNVQLSAPPSQMASLQHERTC